MTNMESLFNCRRLPSSLTAEQVADEKRENRATAKLYEHWRESMLRLNTHDS